MDQSVACVVPARLAATRFPGKLLQPLAGVPVIVHTLRRARAAECFSEVVCLTDAEEIRAAAAADGFRAELTGEAANGTDRIGRHLGCVGEELIVNLQGDEPVFPLEGLRILARALAEAPSRVHLLVHADPPSGPDLANPHRVKAGMDAEGWVQDFYRDRPRLPSAFSRLQLGAYGYAREYLRRYAALPVSTREREESHELLRDLTLAPIRAHSCPHPSQSVDVPGDLQAAARLWAEQNLYPLKSTT